MSRIPPRPRKRLHDLARGPAKVINRSGRKGIATLRAGLQKLPRNAALRGTDWDDGLYEPQPSLLRELAVATVPALLVTVVEQGCLLVRDIVKREHKAALGMSSEPQIMLDSEEVAAGIAASLAATDECEHCAECVCECHSEGDEE